MHTRKLFLVLAISLILLTACAPTPEAFNLQTTLDKYLSTLPDDWGTISPADLNQYLQSTKPFLVDVRETKEFTDGGFVAGAINIPIRTFIKNLDKLPAQDQPIVVTCGSGHRSAMAMAALQLLGYKNVKSLAGGLSAWKAANLPVATGAPPEAKTGKAPDVNKDLYNTLDKYFSTLPDGWGTLAPAALNEMLKSSQPFQLDVREAKEIADAGAIAGATKIPIRALVKNLDKLPPDKNAAIVAECANGHRSAITMLALNLLGYTNTRSLAGGINAWIKANLPVVK